MAGKSAFKTIVQQIHLWLGLCSGLVVFIVAITGCIFTFHDELKDVFYEYRFVEVQDAAFIEPSFLLKKANAFQPDFEASMVVYNGTNRPATVFITKKETNYLLNFNPYTGKLIQNVNLETEFFNVIEELHMYLLLPPEIGKQIVGISTIVFIILLISGMILWWPKKLKYLKQRLAVKWSARWRRINYDWHNVTGFYTSIIAVILAITGLAFVYETVHESFYSVANLGQRYETDFFISEIENLLPDRSDAKNPLDIAFRQTQQLKPDSEMYFIWKQPENATIITGAYPKSLHFDHQSNFQFHPKTGTLLYESEYDSKSAGLKLQEMNYGIHTGQLFGLAGKIIVFLCSLFVAALPLSGFAIWYGRKFNKSTKKIKSIRKS
ncbi:PepSY-associated TM helix domain-containing protein [Zunongwangia endophytica]|uniref:PepSY-associated TM helix domain-containing protein n=1 Tax=Zunongwangia endophytica TaxID=1808945 RepID=A0ABV8HBN0_9FLAO|nr:PepSY-associated TM helix domain-containing protein [Zunongwangia endophytica]MDN3593533.1 PepSY-associated TM helix domain-containing protein [Zunongwangia endophytica]